MASEVPVESERTSRARTTSAVEDIYVASQWQLMWRHFKKHRLGLIGLVVLVVLYTGAILSQPLSVHPIARRSEYILMQPTRIHFVDEEGSFNFLPFIYGIESDIDTEEFHRIYTEDKTEKYNLRLFVRGDPYKLWGIFPANLHVIGVEEGGELYLFGTDNLGRDLFSRTISASSISLSIGFIGVVISFVLGSILGGVSGYRGGMLDLVLQRIIEFIQGIPTVPLWMALSAAIPQSWPPLRIYFAITIILSLAGWTGLARTVRGKLLQLREDDYVMAAQVAGASDWRIIGKHLLPSFLSYLIVSITLAIPGMILGETALSFLGLGLRPPTISWGVLMQDAQNIRTVSENPWLMWPVFMVITSVLAFNFVGDAARDAADPYSVQR